MPASEREPIGVKLRGGPGRLDGWQQVYALGWPPPERIAAFEYMSTVAVAAPESVLPDMPDVTYYRATAERSGLPVPNPAITRGCVYEAESSDDASA